MYKLLLTCSLLTITTLFGSPRMYQEEQHRPDATQNLALVETISPKNTVIAFDLHEVLFERYRLSIARHVFLASLRGLIVHGFNPWFWYKARKVWKSKDGRMIAEDFYKRLCREYPPIKAYEEDFMAVSIECEPIRPMVKLVRQLKERGYYLVVLSNIGRETYDKHREKFPEIMSLFDDVFTPSPTNGYTCKPQREFYAEFKEFLSQKGLGDKRVLFVDDLAENIQGAEEAGIIGLRCESPRQVIKFFKEHGIVGSDTIPSKNTEEPLGALSTSPDPVLESVEPQQKTSQKENIL